MWLAWLFPTLFLLCHVWLVRYFLKGWKKQASYNPSALPSYPFVSVLIALRNEEANIPGLITGLSEQSWPADGFEVIAVDDHSVDNGHLLLSEAQKKYPWLKVLTLPAGKAGKKAALQHAFEASKAEIVLLTDADCHIPAPWIELMVTFLLESAARLVIGPVLPAQGKGICKNMFSLEFIALTASGAGAAGAGNPIMCNGASLACLREVIAAQPFDTSPAVSGDDMFLLLREKKQNKDSIRYLKNPGAEVTTPVPSTLTRFFSQRVRWASKSIHYRDPLLLVTASAVFLLNTSLLALLMMALFSLKFILIYFIIISIKSIIDIIFLNSYLIYFKRKLPVPVLLFAEVFLSVFVPLAAAGGFLARFSWKDRVTGR